MVSHSVATYGKIEVNAIFVFVALVSYRKLLIAENKGTFSISPILLLKYCVVSLIMTL